jgi:hypothetical protein
MKAITASTIAACVLTLTACGSPQQQSRTLHDDAAKLVMIENGMSTSQVTQILGLPVTSETRPEGFKCLEYTLLKKSTNFTSSVPQPHYVMLHQGKTIASGQNGCNVEMMSANFHSATFGKYARFIGQ